MGPSATAVTRRSLEEPASPEESDEAAPQAYGQNETRFGVRSISCGRVAAGVEGR